MLAVVLSLAMLMSFVAAAEDTAATAEDTIASHHDDHALESFSDAPAKDSWKYQGLNCAVNNGVMTGHENKIRPDDSLTRAEMVTMMVRVLGAHANKADIEHYVDVIADQWYYEAIQSGVAAKIINGTGNKMMPNDSITREQTFAILARTFLFAKKQADSSASFKDAAAVSAWAADATNALIDAGVVKGDSTNTLRPKSNVSRAEFATMLDRIACLFTNPGVGVAGKTVEGSLIVNDATVDLSGSVIKGDLIITDAVGTDAIDLSNVTVEGRIVIRGGEVTLKEGTTAAEVTVGNPINNTTVKADEGVKVDKVTVAENSNDVEIDVPAKDVVINSTESEVTIKQDAENVTVGGSDNTVKVESGAKVENVTTGGDNTKVEVNKGASVDNVTVNGAGSEVSGNGNVGNATINGSDSTVSTPNTNVTDNSPSTGDKPSGDDNKPSGDKPSNKPTSGTLAGGGSSSDVDIDETGTYITYRYQGGELRKLDAKVNASTKTVEFDFSKAYDTLYNDLQVELTLDDIVFEQLFVKADSVLACTANGFSGVSFNTYTETPAGVDLADILADMVTTTNYEPIQITGSESFDFVTLFDQMNTAWIHYGQWAESLYNGRGITMSYAANGNDKEIIANFAGKIGTEDYTVTMKIFDVNATMQP